MASRSGDSGGLSSRRLTLQHSGGRSPGWMVPGRPRGDASEDLPELPGVAWPVRPRQQGHRLGRAGRRAGRVQPGQERTARARAGPRRGGGAGGSSAAAGKNVSSPARSPAAGPGLSVTTTRGTCGLPAGPAACPRDLRPARGTCGLPAASACSSAIRSAWSRGAEPAGVPDDQAPLALEQVARRPRHPVVITGAGGVRRAGRAGRVAAPADGPQQRQLAGSGLARQPDPLARGAGRRHLSAAAQPQRTGAARAGPDLRGCAPAPASAAGRLAGWPVRSASHAPRRQRSAACPCRAGGQCIRALAPAGSFTSS